MHNTFIMKYIYIYIWYWKIEHSYYLQNGPNYKQKSPELSKVTLDFVFGFFNIQ